MKESHLYCFQVRSGNALKELNQNRGYFIEGFYEFFSTFYAIFIPWLCNYGGFTYRYLAFNRDAKSVALKARQSKRIGDLTC